MHCNSASLHESSATNGSATNLNARAKLHYQSKPSSFTISCVKMSSSHTQFANKYTSGSLEKIKSSSKSHQKFIKSSSKSLKSPFRAQKYQKFIKSSSKVHQKCNAARVNYICWRQFFN